MKEADLLRALRPYRRVRGSDFHQPPTRGDSRAKQLENGSSGSGGIDGDGRIVKRHPLSKQERAEAEKALALAGGGGAGDTEGRGLASDESTGAVGGSAGKELLSSAEFYKAFDTWIDSKYPGDRGSATKVKVAFRKQHRSMVATLCLEDIEEIAQALQ